MTRLNVLFLSERIFPCEASCFVFIIRLEIKPNKMEIKRTPLGLAFLSRKTIRGESDFSLLSNLIQRNIVGNLFLQLYIYMYLMYMLYIYIYLSSYIYIYIYIQEKRRGKISGKIATASGF